MKSNWCQNELKTNSNWPLHRLFIDFPASLSTISSTSSYGPLRKQKHASFFAFPPRKKKKKSQDLSISNICFLSGFIQQWEFPVSGCSTARCSSLKVKYLTSTTPHLTNSNHPLYSKLAKARPAFPHWKSHKLPVAYSFSSSSELKTERGKSPSDHKRTEPIKAFAILETHHQVSDQAVSLDQEIEGFPQLHRDLTK